MSAIVSNTSISLHCGFKLYSTEYLLWSVMHDSYEQRPWKYCLYKPSNRSVLPAVIAENFFDSCSTTERGCIDEAVQPIISFRQLPWNIAYYKTISTACISIYYIFVKRFQRTKPKVQGVCERMAWTYEYQPTKFISHFYVQGVHNQGDSNYNSVRSQLIVIIDITGWHPFILPNQLYDASIGMPLFSRYSSRQYTLSLRGIPFSRERNVDLHVVQKDQYSES